MICIDASIAAKWAFVEEYSHEARALLRDALNQQEQIVAPPLLPSEFANIVRQKLRQGQVRLDEARTLLAQFLAIPIRLYAPDSLYDRSLVLADQHNLPAIYDAHYVAVADLLGVTLWTADQRLLRTIGGRLPKARSIADYGA